MHPSKNVPLKCVCVKKSVASSKYFTQHFFPAFVMKSMITAPIPMKRIFVLNVDFSIVAHTFDVRFVIAFIRLVFKDAFE